MSTLPHTLNQSCRGVPAPILPVQRLQVPKLPVDLWSCRVDDLPAGLLANPRALCILSPTEQHRLAAFRFDRDRLRYLAGRLLLRHTLSRYAAIPPADWQFVPNAFGRPELAPATASRALSRNSTAPPSQQPPHPGALRFNLSRAGSLVVLAVSRSGHVGVDVEDEQRCLAAEELAPGVLAADELAVFRTTPPPRRRAVFLRYWVLKEAYAKARGMGLSLDVRHVRFTPPGPGAVRVSLTDDASTGKPPATREAGFVDTSAPWRFQLAHLDDRYPLAIAFQSTPAAFAR